MKKQTALLLALSLLSLTACGGGASAPTGGATTPAETTAPEARKSLLDELGEKDFGGRTFTMLDANDWPDVHINFAADERTGDTINDALYDRDVTLGERYNMEFKYIQIDPADDGCALVKSDVMAGDRTYDLVMTHLMKNSLRSLATEGIIQNLLEAPYLSLDQNWWSHLMYDSLRLNGAMYFSTGDITPSFYQMPMCVYVNLTNWDKYGLKTDLFGAVREGKWTTELMESLSKDLYFDLNNDDVMNEDDDFFGFCAEANALTTDALLIGGGVTPCEEKDGKLVVSLGGEQAGRVIERAQTLFAHLANVRMKGSKIEVLPLMKADRALFLLDYVESAISYFRDMQSDYWMLPVPKFDETQKEYRCLVNSYIDGFIALPLTADSGFSGFITEAMARSGYENIRPLAYDLVFKQKAARDEDSAEMVDLCFDTAYIDFYRVYEFGGLTTKMRDVILGKAPLASTLASSEAAVNTALEQLLENWNH